MQSDVDSLRRSVVRDMGRARQPSRTEVVTATKNADFASMISVIQGTLEAFNVLEEKLQHCEDDLQGQRQLATELRTRATEAERELAATARLLAVEKERVAVLEGELRTVGERKRVVEDGARALNEQIQKLADAVAPTFSAQQRKRSELSA